MGGIGKTQLAIAYSKLRQSAYSSVFMLNATSEGTLKSSLRNLIGQVLPRKTVGQLDDDRLWSVASGL
jgi:hypothetical protein